MFRRAITLRMRMGSGAEELNGAAQPFLQLDPRLVAEHLARGAQVGVGVADVAGTLGREVPLDWLPEQAADRLRDIVHAPRLAARDVERAPACALGITGG